jgi:hypothetical protein
MHGDFDSPIIKVLAACKQTEETACMPANDLVNGTWASSVHVVTTSLGFITIARSAGFWLLGPGAQLYPLRE